MKRLPLNLFIFGAALKTLLVVLWRLFQPIQIYDILITYDPIGIWIANITIAIMFDRLGIGPFYVRPFMPLDIAPMLFDVVLIVTFAFQCYAIGIIIQKIKTKLKKFPRTS